MEIVLVPGLWLNATTFDAVIPALREAGHVPHALTLPGMESKDADRAGVTLDDHVAEVVAALEAANAPVLLVAHSAGSGIAHMALDQRPDAVARVVHVGGFPVADGEILLEDMPATDGEVPMPDWREVGEDANVRDLSQDQLAALYADAIPVPEGVVTSPVRLHDERRHAVPMTLVCPEYTVDDAREWVADGFLPEVAASGDVAYVELGGGHWPQLTQPDALARVILAEAARVAG